jgi:hypothetical protein
MELLLISAACGLTGMVWVSRVRFARRFNAAIDAYAELETSRERHMTRALPGLGGPENDARHSELL